MAAKPLNIAVLGFGGRAEGLTKYVLEHPEYVSLAEDAPRLAEGWGDWPNCHEYSARDDPVRRAGEAADSSR